jgi:hypothetical protein
MRGAVAFKRAGDPNVGEFSDAVVLKKFGDVPESFERAVTMVLLLHHDRWTPCHRPILVGLNLAAQQALGNALHHLAD